MTRMGNDRPGTRPAGTAHRLGILVILLVPGCGYLPPRQDMAEFMSPTRPVASPEITKSPVSAAQARRTRPPRDDRIEPSRGQGWVSPEPHRGPEAVPVATGDAAGSTNIPAPLDAAPPERSAAITMPPDDPSSPVEDLETAWALALNVDDGLVARRLDTAAEQAEVSAAESERLGSVRNLAVNALLTPAPSVSVMQPGASGTDGGGAGASGAGFGGILGQGQNNLPLTATVYRLPIYTGGRLLRTIEAESGERDASQAHEVQAQLDLKLAVAEAYVRVLRSRKHLGVTESNVRRLDSFLNDVRARKEQGAATREDELSAEVALAEAHQDRIRATTALESAWAAYNRRLRLPPGRTVPLTDLAIDPAEPGLDIPLEALAGRAIRNDPIAVGLSHPDVERLVRTALATRPELVALDAQAGSLEARAEARRAELLPQVSLAGGHLFLGSDALDDQNFLVGTAMVDWAPIDFGATRRRADAIELRRAATLHRRAEAAADIALEVRTRWLELEEARRRIHVAERAMDRAEEALEVARDQYREGLNIYTQVLDAEARLVRSRSNAFDAAYDAVLAAFRLGRAVGTL